MPFVAGGQNYIRIWINNTGLGVYGTPSPHGGQGDPSAVQAYGSITLDQLTPEETVPEPTALALVGIGLVSLTLLRRRI